MPARVRAALFLAAALIAASGVFAEPVSVTVAGSMQSELGCPADWSPSCATTSLTYDANDDVWQGSWTIPTGNFEYKAALNGTWDVNYGVGGVLNGANIALALPTTGTVKFYYDDKTHWITDSLGSVIVTAAGSFQSELGCASDWDPSCLRSWLQDLDGDGIYTFLTTALPLGSYEMKAAISESWDVNYGAGGAPGGTNISFDVSSLGQTILFRYDSRTHLLSVGDASQSVPEPATLALVCVALAGGGLVRHRRNSEVQATAKPREQSPDLGRHCRIPAWVS